MAVWHSQQRWFTVMWLLYSQNTFPHSPHRANIGCTVSASYRQMSSPLAWQSAHMSAHSFSNFVFSIVIIVIVIIVYPCYQNP